MDDSCLFICCYIFFFVAGCAVPRDLHPFPTRRSSDLTGQRPLARERRARPEGVGSGEQRRQGRREAVRPPRRHQGSGRAAVEEDRKSTRLNSSHVRISYAVFCLKKKKKK